MFHGSERIQELVRQASSLHVVNSVYYLGLLVLLFFCFQISGDPFSVNYDVQSDDSSYSLGIVFGVMSLLGIFKIVMQYPFFLARVIDDDQFELIIASCNAMCTFLIIRFIADEPLLGDVNLLLNSFVPMVLFILITPLTWRKSGVFYVGFYGFIEWSLLLVVFGWCLSVFVDLFQMKEWGALLSNIMVFSSPVFLSFLRRRHVVKLTEKIQAEVYTDPLTQIANRKCFYDFYDELRKKSKSGGLRADGLALFFVDVDWFKQYNDRYGHEQGDVCLVYVANYLSVLAKRLDLTVFRTGGEEFLMCGTITNSRWDDLFADPELQSWINGDMPLDMPHDLSPYGVLTLSGGVVMVTNEQIYFMNAMGVTNAADKCLYHAKKSGRGKLCLDNLDNLDNVDNLDGSRRCA
jgi:diguanylate cyclase (GGDEF)-like protein